MFGRVDPAASGYFGNVSIQGPAGTLATSLVLSGLSCIHWSSPPPTNGRKIAASIFLYKGGWGYLSGDSNTHKPACHYFLGHLPRAVSAACDFGLLLPLHSCQQAAVTPAPTPLCSSAQVSTEVSGEGWGGGGGFGGRWEHCTSAERGFR